MLLIYIYNKPKTSLPTFAHLWQTVLTATLSLLSSQPHSHSIMLLQTNFQKVFNKWRYISGQTYIILLNLKNINGIFTFRGTSFMPTIKMWQHVSLLKWQKPHNLSNCDSHITRQLGYKHSFCQNVVSTKNCLSSYFYKNTTCLRAGLLRIGHVFCLQENCISVAYHKSLFHEQHKINISQVVILQYIYISSGKPWKGITWLLEICSSHSMDYALTI